jgi:FlaG/FlaF family flagellin (archaellin)
MTYLPPPPPPEKSNNTALKVVGVVLAVVIILAAFIIALPLLNNAGNNLANKVNPPNAAVTSTNLRTGTSGLDYIAYVDVSVHNNGGAGTVVVWAKLTQGANSWTKSQSVYLDEKGSQELTLTFSEASFWSLNDIHSTTWVEN